MTFEILHSTAYRYSHPASEAYLEVRLTPPQNNRQEILEHRIEFSPTGPSSQYVDYFGNVTDFFSMTLRHEKLTITNRLRVRTRAHPVNPDALALTVAEARQIFSSSLTEVYDYLQATAVVPVSGVAKQWGGKWLKGDVPMGEALQGLNHRIHNHFVYKSGSTDNRTPLAEVWKKRVGVCQDFAHVMLGILRTAGIPARYVCGYIESEPPRRQGGTKGLVGSLATHAWVEVMLPGKDWVGLDPTNNCWCAEQHVAVSFGRDSRDAAPVKGTFKTSGRQTMKIRVQMKRLAEKS